MKKEWEIQWAKTWREPHLLLDFMDSIFCSEKGSWQARAQRCRCKMLWARIRQQTKHLHSGMVPFWRWLGHQHQHLWAVLHRAMPQTSVARLADLSQVIYWDLSLPIPLQCPPTKSFGVAEWNPHLHPLPKQSVLTCSKRCPTAGPEFFLTSYLFSPTRGHQHCILWDYFTTKRVPLKETGGGRNKRDSSSRFQICSNPLFLGAPIYYFFSKVLIQKQLCDSFMKPLTGDGCVEPLIGDGSSQAYVCFSFPLLTLGPHFKQWDYRKGCLWSWKPSRTLGGTSRESWEIPDSKCLWK